MQVVSMIVRHDCPFSRPVLDSRARVTHLCHRGDEAMLEIHAADPEGVTRLVEVYQKLGGEVLYRDAPQSAALLRFAKCACCRSGQVIPAIERQGHLYLPPSSYSFEGESYQFLAQEERLDSKLMERLPAGDQVVRIGTKPLSSLEFEGGFLVPVGALFRDLTSRQRQAIVTAILRGYYRIPRAVTVEEMAHEFGISRPAYQTLLRKAENKLVAALFPYLTVQGTPPQA